MRLDLYKGKYQVENDCPFSDDFLDEGTKSFLLQQKKISSKVKCLTVLIGRHIFILQPHRERDEILPGECEEER